MSGSVRFIVTNGDYNKLCRHFARKVLTPAQTPPWTFCPWDDIERHVARSPARVTTFFISRVMDIPDRVPFRSLGATPRYLLFAEGLPVEAIASRLPRLGIRDARRLHIARESKLHEIARILFRLMQGNLPSRLPHSIVDAWVENDRLVLLSPSFERLCVPLDKLAAYIGKDDRKVRDFRIDEYGSFIYWPHADAHFDWEGFLTLVDPAALLAAEQRAQAFNQRYGEAIRTLREKAGLKQADVDGLTDRNLRRVEQGQIPATKATLTALAKAHRLPLDEYLDNLATQMKAASASR